jgi:hypothetical protein
MKCPDCNNDFPPELLSDMTVGYEGGVRYEKKCPPCALRLINETAGLPPGTPFRGPKAAAMYDAAVRHLKATGQL